MTSSSTNTSRSSSGFGDSAAQGGRWGAVKGVVLQVFTLISTFILARILSPEEFGFVAAAMVVVGLFELLTGFGFGVSLVRRDRLRDQETSTVFWMAMIVGMLAFAVAIPLAVPLAQLIGQPQVSSMIIVLALAMPLGLTGNVARSLLLRDLRFRAVALVEVFGVATYLVIAVGLAVSGLGAWSIILGYLAKGLINTGAFFALSRWRPSFTFDRSFVRDEVAFSGGILGNQWLSYVNGNLDYWVVSATLGAEALGAYYIAYVMPNLIRRRLTSVAQEVLYPILSRFREDLSRAKEAYLRVLRLVSFIALPALGGLAVVASLAVSVAFGDGWEATASPLALLAVAAALMALAIPGGSVIYAFGRPHLLMAPLGAGTAVLALGLFLVAPSGDLTLVALTVLVSAFVKAAGVQVVVRRLLNLSWGRLMVELLPAGISSAGMALLVYLSRSYLSRPHMPWLRVLVLVLIGVVAYVIFHMVLFRKSFRASFGDLRAILLRTSPEGATE